jgi:FlaA1/EpsC-like NDP-sugar epimerase
VNLIFRVASLAAGDGLFLPEMGQPVKILAIAERLLELTESENRKNLAVEFIGLRPGDKLVEDLLSPAELLEPTPLRGIHKIAGPAVAATKIDTAFERIAERAHHRDLPALLDAIREIIPEYEPGAALLDGAPLPMTKSSLHG